MKNFMRNKKPTCRFIITILSIFIFIFIDCNFFITDIAFDYVYSKLRNAHNLYVQSEQKLLSSENLTMYTLDVEQSECLLFVQNNKVLLIDTGVPEYGIKVAKYLKELGISKIDLLICTHPHYDHMGGLNTILREFEIGTMYMTNYDHSQIHKWWTYRYKKVMYFKDISYLTPTSGESISFSNSTVQFISPISSNYENLNDYSIGVKITFGEIDFLCLGDSERSSELEILHSDFDIQSEVFKVSHHGSTTSNDPELIEKINPEYAIISVGKTNHYGHPRKFVLDTLLQNDITVLRTDLNGTIVLTTDGKTISSFTSKNK